MIMKWLLHQNLADRWIEARKPAPWSAQWDQDRFGQNESPSCSFAREDLKPTVAITFVDMTGTTGTW